jgi:flagellar biosynthetic protein FliP
MAAGLLAMALAMALPASAQPIEKSTASPSDAAGAALVDSAQPEAQAHVEATQVVQPVIADRVAEPDAQPSPPVLTLAGVATAAPVAGSAQVSAQASAQLPTQPADLATPVRIAIGLTVLALIPALLVCLTSFLRISIVLSMLRHAIGMPETPPNTVLIGMSLFLTLFTMSPVLDALNREAVQPFMQGKLGVEATYARASQPLRAFMIRQTREQDLALMVELSKAPRPSSMDDISNVQLIPAFMLSELRAAFQIGFVVFLPFLLIDLIVSSMLMALGMMMMPPITVALPLKVLMFILVDGWSLILRALVGSFH